MAENRQIRRGHLYWIQWSPARGSEAAGRRPALVVQRDAGNRATQYPNTVVVAVSSQGREVPLHVRLKPTRENGLRNTSFVRCEQILTISKERVGARLGQIRADELRQVEAALRLNLSLDEDDADLSPLH